MNTKEAIESIEEIKNFCSYSRVTILKKNFDENLDKIKRFLQRGEKYEKMWGELEKENKRYSYSYIATTKYLMDKVKQKYFPEE